ncbi:MAG TPA: hypothetical protein VGR15_09115, partial [Bacteroidota bacterium]|nr:hypothetical protein [Bacteroidota bacterium]
MGRTGIVAFLSFILLHECTLAQFETLNEDWRWVQFTTQSGLPSNHILELVESSDSTPWVATTSGIAWYDGFRWTTVFDSGAYTESTVSLAAMGSGDMLVVAAGSLFRCTRSQIRRIDLGTNTGGLAAVRAADAGGGRILIESVGNA